MLIKRFEGPTMQQVVRQVRAEFGPDAIVLSQRTRNEGGWLGRGGTRVVELTAAIDRDRLQLPTAAAPANGATRAPQEPSWEPLQLTRALIEPLEDEIRSLRRAVDDAKEQRNDGALAEQIRELKELAQKLGRPGELPSPHDPAAAFLRAGLRFDLAEGLAKEVAARMADGEDEGRARVEVLANRLEERLATPRPDLQRSQMVIGAPGVGKTTTLAKLVDRHPRNDLILLSADTSRREGSARLRGAASELGVPFEELDSARGLKRLRARTVFVDTPGFTARESKVRTSIADIRSELGADAEIQLVVAATTKQADLEAQLRAAERCRPSSLIVTSTDETHDLASVVNLILQPGTPPLAWLGCGQAIPADLELPDPRALAESVVSVSA